MKTIELQLPDTLLLNRLVHGICLEAGE